jgi:phosphoribosylaminoimidazole-succinocarboxamide synthase
MISQQFIKNLPFDNQNYQLVEYPDFFSLNQDKKVKVKDLGQKFAAISSFFLDYLREYHIPCAYIKKHEINSLMFVKFQQLPFVVKILNSADKRTAKLFSLKEGVQLNLPVFEYHVGDSKNSIVSESHLISFDLCTNEDLKIINRICSKVNAVLKSFFERRNETIGELTCSFGKFESKIYLVDDFTPLSLKIFPNKENNTNNWVNPYNLNSSSEMRKYTDHLYNITSS